MCAWVQRNTPPNAIFLTPRGQQTFKWYAGRSEVAVWKDIPQDASAIVAWWHRIRDCYPPQSRRFGWPRQPEQLLQKLAAKYGFEYVVVDRTAYPAPLSFPRVYPPPDQLEQPIFEVYRVPRPPGELPEVNDPHAAEEDPHARS
jgi:hypothetical protein